MVSHTFCLYDRFVAVVAAAAFVIVVVAVATAIVVVGDSRSKYANQAIILGLQTIVSVDIEAATPMLIVSCNDLSKTFTIYDGW